MVIRGERWVSGERRHGEPGHSCLEWGGDERNEGSRWNPSSPRRLERFWTEHSERSTMTICLAAIGTPKSDGSQKDRTSMFVHTMQYAVVRKLQRAFAEPIRTGRGHEDYDEGAVLE